MSTPKILFTLNRSKITKAGTIPIVLRITNDKSRACAATGYKVMTDSWDQVNQAIKDDSELAKTFNAYANKIRYRALQVERELHLTGLPITSKAILDGVIGRGPDSVTLLQAIKAHNARSHSLIGKDITRSTYNRYLVTERKITDYLATFRKEKDILLDRLTIQFISDFEHYLKTFDDLGQNTTAKHLKNLKKIIRFAITQQWLKADPFSTFRCRTVPTDRGYLSRQELKIIEEKALTTDRLSIVRNIFVFACYTGLSFSDLHKLTPDNIFLDDSGAEWISIKRTKTGAESLIPVLPKAKTILECYKNHPECRYKNKLLPTRSNQKMNEYLGEIADLCGIEKRVTCHLARHTFATTITLANGVSTEIVSKMLGHKNIRTTQIYAKMTLGRIALEMKEIHDKL